MDTKFLAFLLIILWGAWGVFEKKAVSYVHPLVVAIYGNFIYFALTPIYFFLLKANNIHFVFNKDAIFWPLINGITCAASSLIMLFLLTKTTASWAVSVTAAYPVITLVLCVLFLKEKIDLYSLIGIILVSVGLVFLNIPKSQI